MNPILDLASDGSRKAPEIRLNKEMSGVFYLDRWHCEAGKSQSLMPCKTRLLTPDKLIIESPTRPDALLFDRIFVHLEEVGLLRGKISRVLGGVVYMNLILEDNARARLASQILFIHRRENSSTHDVQPFPRYRPFNERSRLSMAGQQLNCLIASISPAGAEIITGARPTIKAPLTLGQVDGHVTSHTDSGFDMSFRSVQDPRILEDLVFVDHTADYPVEFTLANASNLALQHSQMVN